MIGWMMRHLTLMMLSTDELNQPIGEAEPNDQRCKQLNFYIHENYV